MDLRARISDSFTWWEVLHTSHRDPAIMMDQYAPPVGIQRQAIRFARELLEEARQAARTRLRISSWYRCPPLNAAVGGSPSSAHMAAQAADVHPLDCGLIETYERIAAAPLPLLDQLILEYGTWIHIGGTFAERAPRHDLLMIWEAGHYEKWNPNDQRVIALRENT